MCEVAMTHKTNEDTSAWDDNKWGHWRWRVEELGVIFSEETSNEDPQRDEEIHVPHAV